jgi:hypothetical protein
MFEKVIGTKEELLRVIEALEILHKEYTISTIKLKSDHDFRIGFPPRWIVKEVSKPNDNEEGRAEQ